MKKFILTLALAVSLVGALNAQVDGKAIGLRFSPGFGNSAEISYLHPLGNTHRLEADLGLSNNGLFLTGVYQWVWDLSDLADGFNWYAGVGGNVGLWNGNHNYTSGMSIGFAGQIGIEYNFNIPLQLSLDYRPIINVIPTFGNGYFDGVALGVRYKF